MVTNVTSVLKVEAAGFSEKLITKSHTISTLSQRPQSKCSRTLIRQTSKPICFAMLFKCAHFDFCLHSMAIFVLLISLPSLHPPPYISTFLFFRHILLFSLFFFPYFLHISSFSSLYHSFLFSSIILLILSLFFRSLVIFLLSLSLYLFSFCLPSSL
jgi:hypothetical protein